MPCIASNIHIIKDRNKPKRTKRSENQTHHEEKDLGDEDILSSDEEGVALTSKSNATNTANGEGKDFEETVDEKRMRLAKQLLSKLKQSTEGDEELDDDALQQKLKEEAVCYSHCVVFA